jgi:hypothetical protein
MNRPDAIATDAPSAPRARPALGLAARAAVVCAILVGSGAARWWQARRVEASMNAGRERQFKLDEIPLTLGDWSGERTVMDERIVKATGSDDQITRRYVDGRTGVALDVIVLYGPTSDIFIHSPEVCYPKAGFGSHGETVDRTLALGDAAATFRSVAYAKGDPGGREIQDVYFSWRYNGAWTPTVGAPKQLDRIPGMYKVQVARRLTQRETRADERDPCEAFLGVLIPDLESRITGGGPSPATPPKP